MVLMLRLPNDGFTPTPTCWIFCCHRFLRQFRKVIWQSKFFSYGDGLNFKAGADPGGGPRRLVPPPIEFNF